MTPHEKQVMMFSATLSKEIRPVCRKFMQDVINSLLPSLSTCPAGQLLSFPKQGRSRGPEHRTTTTTVYSTPGCIAAAHHVSHSPQGTCRAHTFRKIIRVTLASRFTDRS